MNQDLNIVLIGLRGSGKSQIGKMLSKKLKRPHIDFDLEIEKEEQLSVSEIVENKGWDYFRAQEKIISEKFANKKGFIISTGGGTVIDQENTKHLKKTGRLVYLYTSPETCTKRILNSKNRPPLSNLESLEEEMKLLYKKRNGIYCKAADLIFQRSNNLEKDTNELAKKLQ